MPSLRLLGKPWEWWDVGFELSGGFCSVSVSEGQQKKSREGEGCGSHEERQGSVGWSGKRRQSFHTGRGRIEAKKENSDPEVMGWAGARSGLAGHFRSLLGPEGFAQGQTKAVARSGHSDKGTKKPG